MTTALNLSTQKALGVIGLGSFGSQLVNNLARSACRIGCLVDPDKVETRNLSKAQFFLRDIGQFKAEVLARQIYEIQACQVADRPIRTHLAWAEDLPVSAWDELLLEHELLVLTSDSRQALRTAVEQSMRFFRVHGKAVPLVISMGFENLSGGLVQLWIPGQPPPCPVCLLSRLHYISTSDTRLLANPENYTIDRIIHEKQGEDVVERGLVADVQYGIALTTALILGLLDPKSGRGSIVEAFIQAPVRIWSGFRQPYLAWQHQSLMGAQPQPVRIEADAGCLLCRFDEPQADPVMPSPDHELG